MKISLQAPEGFDPASAPHRVILEAEHDGDIVVLLKVAHQLLQDQSEKSPILLPKQSIAVN